jgi:hypothetical protein
MIPDSGIIASEATAAGSTVLASRIGGYQGNAPLLADCFVVDSGIAERPVAGLALLQC